MTDFSPLEIIRDNTAVFIPVLLALLGLIIYYYVLIIRAVLQMLNRKVPSVLLTFSFIALVPSPFTVLLGVTILIIWHYHKKDYQTG